MGICAEGDPRCRPGQVSAWTEVAGAEFQERWFGDVLRPGAWATQHRYVTDNPTSLLRFLRADLPLVGCPVEGDSGFDGPIPGTKVEEPLEVVSPSGGAQADSGMANCQLA